MTRDCVCVYSRSLTYLGDYCAKKKEEYEQPEERWPRVYHVHNRNEDASEDAASGQLLPKKCVCHEAGGLRMLVSLYPTKKQCEVLDGLVRWKAKCCWYGMALKACTAYVPL